MIPAVQPVRRPVSCLSQIYQFPKKLGECIVAIFKRIFAPIAGYFLKICVFRDAALQGRCSKVVIAPLARGIINTWMKCQKIPDRLHAFDAKRLKKSADFLTEFAEMRTCRAEDGTKIEWALFTPEKFNQWVAENGGIREGEWIRPKTDADWGRLERLREFRWFEEEGHAFRVPLPQEGAQDTCVLRCQGFGRKIPMDKGMIGLHLAAGFQYAVFNWRDKISAKGFFQDAEAVYQSLLREGFSPRRIKAMGSCRATFVVSRLKELHHREGLDVVMIHTQPSLRAAVAAASWPANKIGLLGLGEIEKEGADFDTLRRLSALERADSRICLIMSEGDKTVPADAIQNLTEVAKRIGECELIVEPKGDRDHDPHFEEPLRNKGVLSRCLSFLAIL